MDGRHWSYAELDAEADRWAGMLAGRGIAVGARVAALATNRAELVHLFFACGRLGSALVPLNWRLAPPELALVIADAQPALILGEQRFRATAEQARTGPEIPWVDLDAEAPILLSGSLRTPPARATDPEDPWLVLYTSGSTGKPKGAILPHRQILYNAVSTTIGWQLGPDEVGPISTPLFHTGGWNVFATPLWFRGGTVVLCEAFEPEGFLQMLQEEGCTVALTVPTQLLLLRQSEAWGIELPRLKYFISGGAPCPATLADQVRTAGYGFREGYGLTECGPNCFATTEAIAAERAGTVGYPMPFLEMRIVDDAGVDTQPGKPGELLLRGPQMFGGYLRVDVADTPGPTDPARDVVTAGGWLRTGDIAVQDQDGVYSICGRRKEMFISGGENVFPGEVEAALIELPQIAEVVVVGVPDPHWGEVGRAYVVCQPGATLTETEVRAHAQRRLAGYKRPRSILVVPEIPRLGSGKPDRVALSRVVPPSPPNAIPALGQ